MDKFFKRTLLGAAVAAAAVAGSANAAVPLAGDAVQFYGQAAGFMTWADSGDDSMVGTTIESRIGFRGVVEFEDFAPNLIWQIEGGNANNGGFDPNQSWTHSDNGQLGARDTFLGLDFEGVGSFKFGRQLVAAYNYVDWPHSNPGLGNVFDWNNGDIKASFEDRANNVLRFDSANFNGFNFQATLSGMASNTDQVVGSVGTSYTTGLVSVHAGYYKQNGYDADVAKTEAVWGDKNGTWQEITPAAAATTEKAGDVSYYIVGGSMFLGDVTLTAAMKHMENGAYDGKDSTAKQTAYSATAQYVLDGKWVFKAGYAATDDAKVDGTKLEDTKDLALNARLGYLLPSTYLYVDSRNYKMDNSSNWTNAILVGAEYYF